MLIEPRYGGVFYCREAEKHARGAMSKINTVAMSSVLVALSGVRAVGGTTFGQAVYWVPDQHGNVTFTDNPGQPFPTTTFRSLCPSKAHRWKRG